MLPLGQLTDTTTSNKSPIDSKAPNATPETNAIEVVQKDFYFKKIRSSKQRRCPN